MPDIVSCKAEFATGTCQTPPGLLHWQERGVRMKKTVITVIRIIVIVAILGLLTYGGFVGMNRVSGTGDYTIDQYAATDDGGLLTVTKAGTTVHVKCSADQLAAVAAQPDGTFHLSFSYSQITNSGTLKDITPAG